MTVERLGDVADLVRGVSFDGAEASAVDRPGYLPILRAGNLADVLRLDEDLVWVPSSRVAPSQRMIPGDLAICMSSGSASVVGKTSMLERPFPGSVGAFCGLIRPGPRLVPRYLAAWFRSPTYRAWRDSQSRGASIQNLRMSALAEIELPVPDLTVQRRVAANLAGQFTFVEAASAATTGRSRALGSLRSRTYELAFMGIVPFSAGPPSDRPPDRWAWHALTDLARLETGHTPSRRRPDWWSGDIPWIALPDIRRVDGRVAFETLETTNPEGIAHSAARVLPTDTVVMSRTASVGFVTRMGRPMATSQDFVNWVCGPDLDSEFLMQLLIRSRDEIRALSSGAIHKTVYFPTVKAFRVCVPAIGEQRRIAAGLRERLAAIDAMEASIRAEREAIEALPAVLLRRAFEDLVA